MENTNFILLISCISIGALSLLFNIILMARLSQVNKRMDDHGRFIYQMMKRSDEVKETSNDTSEGVTKVNETVTSLTSSIRSLVKQNQAQLKKANETIYPGPQLLQLVDQSITENILMTAVLIQKQHVVSEDPLIRVSRIVEQTFPHVNPTYIKERCIYIMEDYNRSQTGQKAQ